MSTPDTAERTLFGDADHEAQELLDHLKREAKISPHILNELIEEMKRRRIIEGECRVKVAE